MIWAWADILSNSKDFKWELNILRSIQLRILIAYTKRKRGYQYEYFGGLGYYILTKEELRKIKSVGPMKKIKDND